MTETRGALADVPLLKESTAFVRRLEQGLHSRNECRYHAARRVNWSYRYASQFHAAELELFCKNPDAYLAIPLEPTPQVEDVFVQSVSKAKLLEVVAKVAAHWLFAAVGYVMRVGKPLQDKSIYRKCYVDEMENIYDPDESGVMRYVYPFPLSVKRQLRYFQYLARKRYPFRTAGYPYDFRDLFHFILRRDVRSLQKLESRAQVRLGRLIRSQRNWKTLQLADEFDICGLDFVRSVKRSDLQVVNAAHGVGKYFPFHAYDEFRILMQRQEEYYKSIFPCRYVRQDLRSSGQDAGWADTDAGGAIQLVFVSQTSTRAGAYLGDCEHDVLQRLRKSFQGRDDIELWIKVHPNRKEPLRVEGFQILQSLSMLRSEQNTVFVSFFSTSHIDPAFKGRRYLLNYELLKPAIAFDDDGSILDLEGFIRAVTELLTTRQRDSAPELGRI